MPLQGYSVGRDITLVVILPGGLALQLGIVTSWNAKQETTDQRVKRIDGNTDHLRFFDGWSGSFKMERDGPAIDQYFADLEANFFAGDDEPPATIVQTISEPDGSVSEFRFERVLLRYDDAGEWGSDKSVSQALSFMAARRIQQV